MTSQDRIGQTVGGYVLERIIGKGGMSVVYFARDAQTGRGAAIKIVQSGLPANMAAERRLEQEARAISRIGHEHVVNVFGWGQTPDRLPYIIMECLRGKTLAHVVSVGQIVPPARMINLARQMLSALERAHALDIIHRDLKPDNVFLVPRDGEQDFVKMLDFGIAKLLGPQPHSLVQTVKGLVLGTPEYLPPELAMGQAVSPATDIYALGVIIFEGLTGRLPFPDGTAGELAEHHCFTPAPTLRSVHPGVHADLERIVLKCLAKSPAERYQSADALARALAGFAGQAQSSRTVELAGPDQRPSDNAAIERVLRAAAEAHGPQETLPAGLTASLEAIDSLRARTEALGTELALVEDALAEISAALALREGELLDALQRDAVLSEELRGVRQQDASLVEGLEASETGRPALDELAAFRPAPNSASLRAVLTSYNLALLQAHLRSASTVEGLIERRRGLHAQYTDLAHRQGRANTDRASLEASLVIERARVGWDQDRLSAQRLGLRIELDALERAFGRALACCAVELTIGFRS
ncbi:MAG: serine/threonine protein kinase [Bradymonadia bacterium]|jgi:serine/threonine protein kinase